uniref:Uncharacterized protein n=1 Tax=Magallana gigas TaxID=29159 RepID=K1QCM1_MAGGI
MIRSDVADNLQAVVTPFSQYAHQADGLSPVDNPRLIPLRSIQTSDVIVVGICIESMHFSAGNCLFTQLIYE